MRSLWAYCRVSTRKEEQEESLEAQEAWARDFAAKSGAAIRVICERASAKSTVGRPVFNRMIADLGALSKAERPELLLVTALDRLSRSTRDTLNVIEALREFKITLFQRNIGPITAEEFPKLAALVGMSLAGEAENYGRSLRTKQMWEKRRAEGKPASNKVPYGLQLRGGWDVPIPDSAAWVLRAFEMYAAGIGTYTIANEFKEGAPPHTWLTTRFDEAGERIKKTRAATKWESNRITKLLVQKRYRATIVPAKLFDTVQERLSKTPRPGNARKREYPLGAALVCSGCNRHLHGEASGGQTTVRRVSGKVKRYPRERTRYYGCHVCDYRFNADRLESQFLGEIGNLRAKDRLLQEWVDAPRIDRRRVASIEREIQQLRVESSDSAESSHRDRIFDAVIKADVGHIEVRRQLERVQQFFAEKRERLRVLQDQLSGVRSSERSLEHARALLSNFRELYDVAEYEKKRELVAALVDALGGLRIDQGGLHWKLKESEIRGNKRRNQPTSTTCAPKRKVRRHA